KIGRHKVLIWSAGCSTGEEPYTLAMVLSEFAKACPGFSFNILATDISTTVLEKAQLGVYDIDKISALPLLLQRRYFIRGNDKNRFCARVIPEIRNNIQFRRLNLLDKEYRIRNQVDIIFCRNVFIYFNRVTQQSVIDKFIERLRPGGYLFLGHTETLAGTKSGLFSVAPAVFRKQL
ncbi:MAG: CheR family methyltransferase, partial [Pseudomonadota bacterium]